MILFKTSYSIIVSLLLYFLTHFICKISNIDLFNKCYFKKEEEHKVCKKMNLFYLLSAIFFFIVIITSLYVSIKTNLSNINMKYQIYLNDFEDTPEFATAYANSYKEKALSDFYISRNITLLSTTIIELGITFSFISLVPYQKKLLNLYNHQ